MDKGNALGDYQYMILQAQGWLDRYIGLFLAFAICSPLDILQREPHA
jgi:hypothetical protein